MQHRRRLVGLTLLVCGGVFAAGLELGRAQQSQQSNLLVISQFVVAEGHSMNASTELASKLVRDLRATKEFRSVRLYTHNWGPDQALYIVQEPNSWQAIRTGWDEMFEANPGLRDMPIWYASHSDNILGEVPVE